MNYIRKMYRSDIVHSLLHRKEVSLRLPILVELLSEQRWKETAKTDI